MTSDRRITLGAFVTSSGVHATSWRLPEVVVTSPPSFETYKRVVRKLEAGCVDTVFMNDSIGHPDVEPSQIARDTSAVRWDPMTLLAALAVVTERIGLTATANTTYNDPYSLARRLASLDLLTNGRAGWNCVTAVHSGENFNFDTHVPHAQRYARAEEFVDVITSLWDSWEDDALVADKATGLWIDPAKMHILNHKGTHFNVRGPLNSPRPPQGYPVIAQAGSSDAGRALAARTAEVIFTAAQTIDECLAFTADLAARAGKFGRGREAFRVLPGVQVTVAETDAEARRKFDRLNDLNDPISRLKQISTLINIGIDLSEYPLDGPVPLPDVIPETNNHRSRQKLVVDLIRRQNPTIRELLRELSATGHRVLIGTPARIADDFEEWFASGACDGFNIMFPEMVSSVDDFVDLVVPELQRRGVYRTRYEGVTLRDHLGLARPENRFSARHAAASDVA
jgi:FMN-dependent oxidoreductase (nitrilotriacetate monooxygenase family)